DLEAAILAHDPSLDVVVPRPDESPRPPAVTTSTGGVAASAGVPLVARDAELAELVAARREAAGDSRFLVLEGAPGGGKTRLAEELAGRARDEGSLVMWGRSDESGAAPALWPWLPVLRAAVAAAVDEVPAPLAEVLAGKSPLVAGQGGAVQFERFDAVADLL